MPELCWWLVRNDLADALPESAARKALRLPKPVVPSVTVAFEEKYGSQLELIFRFIDRALAIGVLA